MDYNNNDGKSKSWTDPITGEVYPRNRRLYRGFSPCSRFSRFSLCSSRMIRVRSM